ncbi:hypothetical protein [Mycobacterium scrofulaceum]|uniref:Uncharacterized protein n=1 Tax=Mycobacterium scrofulaceum TaxID=1783 RepID=A0A1X0KDA1_MYCSC|nr:hypothetical protein [Mycobacterium scrofulaceum]ORB73160.1 hypothetical protein BST44_15505 [Mycobacterium scrofulaceum]
MASSEVGRRRLRLARYAFGGALCLLAGVNVLVGSAWYLSLGVAATGIAIAYGSGRRVFAAGVRRTGEEIVCRYIPWFEGNAYSVLVLIPLIAVAMVAAGHAPGNPAWLLYGGIILLAISALMLIVTLWIWRRSLLRITPSALTVRIPERGGASTDIRREEVRSIAPKLVRNVAAGTESLQTEVVYQPAEAGSDTTAAVMLGQYLTVQPASLGEALAAWKDGAHAGPGELMDRIERILRGTS